MSKNLPSLFLAPLLGAATIATLSACGDEVTEVNEVMQVTQVTGMLVVKKGEALPECGAENEGSMAYSMDSAAAYYCIDEEWTSLQGKDGKDGKDGADGKDGKDGKDGEDGTDGEDGKDGSDAAGCKMTDNDNGSVTIICGADSSVFYKPLCAGKVYNPDSSFCFVTTIYRKCGGKIYEPETESCAQDTIYRHCKTDEEFDSARKFCQGEGIFPKCGGKIYNADSLFCANDFLYEKCDGERYNPLIYFCANNQLLKLCEGMDYDPKTQYCSNNQIFEKNAICGGVGYDSTYMFCDSRDSSAYKFTTIAPEGSDYSETWMAENLNLVIEKSLFGRSDSTSRKYLGRVYYADAPLESLCPQGWHLPDSTEYATLLSLDIGGKCADQLKAGISIWSYPKDRLQFSLYPTHSRNSEDANSVIYYYFQETAALWTSSTRDGNPLLVVIGVDYNLPTVDCIDFISTNDLIDGNFYITYANVRCVKDK